MARKPRILFPGAFYHVYNRGNDRHPVYRDDEDRMKYLWYLTKYAKEMSVVLISYCLLTNHFHLFLRTLLANLPMFMHRLHSAYAKWYNKKRNRTGHLYGSRYQATLVQETNYSLKLSQYIHLNPVRANLVALPEEWRWSSYPHFIGSKLIPFLDSTIVLDQFGSTPEAQHDAYRRFVQEGLEKGTAWIEPPVKDGLFLGDDEFITQIYAKYSDVDTKLPGWFLDDVRTPTIHDILSLLLQESGLSFGTFRESKRYNHTHWRGLFAFLSKKLANASTKQLSQILGLSPSATSKAIYRYESKVLSDRQLRKRVEKIVRSLQTRAIAPKEKSDN